MSPILSLALLALAAADDPAMERIVVAADGRGFASSPSGRPFVPVGFNYDHDETGRLIEDYWHDEWPKVEADFAEMKALGANVVRVHLQFGKFMTAADTPDAKALDRLGDLLKLAEKASLYIDLTGLGCYHKKDVPDWYDALDEAGRWKAQAAFWEAVASRCAASPAVFCYDLMNEPVVPGGRREGREWLGPAFGDKHFVQFVTLDQAGRPRPEVARAWVDALAAATRKHDPTRLVTVGLVDWSLDRPGLTSGFVPTAIAPALDFLCVHIYPEAGKVDDALATLRGFAAAGKPVVIEETFLLKCSDADFRRFLRDSKSHASGWIAFYWGKPLADLRKSNSIGDALLAATLDALRSEVFPPPLP